MGNTRLFATGGGNGNLGYPQKNNTKRAKKKKIKRDTKTKKKQKTKQQTHPGGTQG